MAALHRLTRTSEREEGDRQRMNEAWSAAHAAYHEALVSACDSPWLLRLRAMLYAQTERYRRLSVPATEVARDLTCEHHAITQAALARDARRAKDLMTRHLALTSYERWSCRNLRRCSSDLPAAAWTQVSCRQMRNALARARRYARDGMRLLTSGAAATGSGHRSRRAPTGNAAPARAI